MSAETSSALRDTGVPLLKYIITEIIMFSFSFFVAAAGSMVYLGDIPNVVVESSGLHK